MGSIFRNTARDTIDSAISAQIAAQGDSKVMGEHLRILEKSADKDLNVKPVNDAKAFQRRLGKKGGI